VYFALILADMVPGEWDLIYSVGAGAGSQPGRGMEETIPQGFRFLPFCDNISLIWQLEGKLCPMEPKAIILLSISPSLSVVLHSNQGF
jgi:hypothetical protein